MANQIPEINPIQTCKHCAQAGQTWQWRLVEPGERRYEVLCAACITTQDAGFTPEAAIRQACGIVLITGAELSGRIVRAGGAA